MILIEKKRVLVYNIVIVRNGLDRSTALENRYIHKLPTQKGSVIYLFPTGAHLPFLSKKE